MIHIAIVDDDNLTCRDIEEKLHTICMKLMCRISVDTFNDGESFVDSVSQYEKYDLVFMDIELADMNGIQTSSYIRNELNDQYTQIVFISAKQGYLKQLFDVRPMNFIEKPITSEKIANCIQTYMSLFPTDDVFRIKVGKTIRQQSYKNVIYFQSDNKEIIVSAIDDTYRFNGKLSEVAEIAPAFFWRTHKSYLINQNYIKMHQIDLLIMTNGDRIPISRHYQSEIRAKLMAYYAVGREEIFDS